MSNAQTSDAQIQELLRQPEGANFLDALQKMYSYNEGGDTLLFLEELCNSCHDFTSFMAGALRRRDFSIWTQLRSFVLYHRAANTDVARYATLDPGNPVVAAFGIRGGNWHQLTRELMSRFFHGLSEAAGIVVDAKSTTITAATWFAIAPSVFARAFDEASSGRLRSHKRLTSQRLGKLKNDLKEEAVDIFRYAFDGGDRVRKNISISSNAVSRLPGQNETIRRRGRKGDGWLYDAWRCFWMEHRDSVGTSLALPDFLADRMHVKLKAAKKWLNELNVAEAAVKRARFPAHSKMP